MEQTTTTALYNSTNSSVCVFLGPKNPTLQLLNYDKAITFIPVMIILMLLMISGILGNALVIYVYQFRFKKTPSNRFILWMAILDLFTCLIGVPFEIFDLAKPYTFDHPWGCKFLRFISSTAVVTSSLVLIAVAFDRYFKAFKPFNRLTVKSTNIYNGLALFFGVLLSLPAMWIFGLKSAKIHHEGICLIGKGCSSDDSMKGNPFSYSYYGILLLVYITLIIFQIVLYGRLGREILRRKNAKAKARKTSLKVMSQTNERESTSFLQRDAVDGKNSKNDAADGQTTLRKKLDKATNMVRIGRTTLIFFCVSVAFIVSFLPHIITKILQATIKNFDDFSSDSTEVIYNICSRTQFINNAINPIIYGFLNPNFRVHCAEVLAAIACCKKSSSVDLPRNDDQKEPEEQEKERRVSQSC